MTCRWLVDLYLLQLLASFGIKASGRTKAGDCVSGGRKYLQHTWRDRFETIWITLSALQWARSQGIRAYLGHQVTRPSIWKVHRSYFLWHTSIWMHMMHMFVGGVSLCCQSWFLWVLCFVKITTWLHQASVSTRMRHWFAPSCTSRCPKSSWPTQSGLSWTCQTENNPPKNPGLLYFLKFPIFNLICSLCSNGHLKAEMSPISHCKQALNSCWVLQGAKSKFLLVVSHKCGLFCVPRTLNSSQNQML